MKEENVMLLFLLFTWYLTARTSCNHFTQDACHCHDIVSDDPFYFWSKFTSLLKALGVEEFLASVPRPF